MTVYGFKMQMKWNTQGATQRQHARRRRKVAMRKAYKDGFDVVKADFSFDESQYDVEWTIEIDKSTQAIARAAADALALHFFNQGFVEGAAPGTVPDITNLP